MNKFKIYDIDVSIEHTVDIGKFPGGEIRVQIISNGYQGYISENISVIAVLLNSDDVMTLVMIVDALRELGVTEIRLTMPYIPYARQDRVCNSGEAFSIRAFANIINALEFKSIVVWDAHSIVSTSLIKNCINIRQYECVLQHKELIEWMFIEPIYLVAPDVGSVNKTRAIAAQFPKNIKGVLYAEKVRELSTGKIIATRIASEIPEDFSSSRILICDDICDGGRTFIELAKVLKDYNPKEMSLYVTHGIFSQGKNVLLKPIDNYGRNETGVITNTGLFDNVWSSLNFKDYV